MKKNWSKLLSKAERDLTRSKVLIESSVRGVSGTPKKYKRTSPSKIRER
jgi:hypothetical protein